MNGLVNTVPSYWQEYLQKKIDTIKALQKDYGANGVSFALISDFHVCVNEKHSPSILQKVLNECNIPYFFNAGDVVSGKGIISPQDLLGEIDEFYGLIAPIKEKCLSAEGNHDRAFSTFNPPNYYRENLTKKEFFAKYFSYQTKCRDRVFGDGEYFFVDDKENKVRYIVLNSQDVPTEEKTEQGFSRYNVMTHFGFLQKQLDWLATVALKFPESGWNVVVCSHATVYGISCEQNTYNYGALMGMLWAFNNGMAFATEEKHDNSLFDVKVAVDFSNGGGGNVVAWLGGHTHADKVAKQNGIVCVEIDTDASYGKHVGTTDEQVIDVFTVDLNKKHVKVVRIGRGKDREFSYAKEQ